MRGWWTSLPATAVLEIPVNEVRKDILSIGDTARVREYRVVHQVRFRLVDSRRRGAGAGADHWSAAG